MVSAEHRWILISPEQRAQIETDPHYRQMLLFMEAADWAPAEGWLWWMRERRGWGGLVPIDQPLGCCLVMQGQHRLGLQLLEPLLQHPQRNFWVAHLAGDALRGCNHLEEAVVLYRQAQTDGSDSPLTARNLLQVLWQRDEEAALEQLRDWLAADQLHGAVLLGVQQALASGQAPALEHWLAEHDLATPQQLQRLTEAALERLDRPAAQRWLRALEDSPWARTLQQRLRNWGVAGFSQEDRDGGGDGSAIGPAVVEQSP